MLSGLVESLTCTGFFSLTASAGIISKESRSGSGGTKAGLFSHLIFSRYLVRRRQSHVHTSGHLSPVTLVSGDENNH